MGFLMPKTGSDIVNQNVPEPEKTAQPTQIGSSRKQEDVALFGPGGEQDLRVRAGNTAKGVTSGGTGLRMM